jgi:phosphatidylglycerophosphate synthase
MNRALQYELHAGIMLAAFAITIATGRIEWLLGAGIIAFTIMFVLRRKEYQQNGFLGGPANWITLARLVTLISATYFIGQQASMLYGVVILAIIIADGFDGYVARKYKLATRFGADFDMETDALLSCVLSLIAYWHFDVSLLVPAAGILRYAFVILLRATGLFRYDPPKMPGVRLIAVLFFISLITPYFIDPPFSGWSMEIASGLIFFSFGRELYLRNQVRMGEATEPRD